jgi:fructoselysine-6-P-deglycase FrlB-like protein
MDGSGAAMMTDYTVWHGTKEDLEQLQEAVKHHCECKPPVVSYTGQGSPGTMCDAHKMLTDQTVLDHLDAIHHIAQRYVDAEFDDSDG